MSIEDNIAAINRKFKLLSLEEEETTSALQENKRATLKRQNDVYKVTLTEIFQLKRTAKEQKIEADEEVDEIKTWNQNLN